MNKLLRILASVILLVSVIQVCHGGIPGPFILQDADRWGLGAHPILGYDDESKLTLGAGGVIYHEPEADDQDTDEMEFHASYNGADECDMMVDYNCFSEGNARSTEGSFGFKREYFAYRDVRYRSVDFPFEIGRSFKIKEKVYCGPIYKFKYRDVQLADDKSTPANSDLYGMGIMHLSGFGGRLSYRNLPNGQIYRRKGNILTMTGMVYSHLFLSSANFVKLDFDYRHYIPVREKSVLAFQLVGKSARGDVPFDYLYSLEGKNLLRGGRRDMGRYLLAGQVELRFPIRWRVGGVVFLGSGEVEDRVKSFGSNICVTRGFGLRFALNKKKHINFRLDVAFDNQGDSKKYLTIKEAF